LFAGGILQLFQRLLTLVELRLHGFQLQFLLHLAFVLLGAVGNAGFGMLQQFA
jgi:hypothetical protein